MSANVTPEKNEVRISVTDRRRRRSEAERAQAAQAIALHAPAVAALVRARRVAAYLSMPSEPGTGPLLDWLTGLGTEIVVPVSNADRTLDWVAYAPGEVVVGDLGVPEPTGPRRGESALHACEVAIIPALAVDHGGNRLGRGAGYYDRALADFPGVTCALVYDDELRAELPHEPHDRPVDLVLSPGGLFRPTRGLV